MLQAEPSLCRVAFPEWYAHFSDVKPTLEMTTAAMTRLLTYKGIATRFFFMIDGLDEYGENSIGKASLADLMLDLAQSPNIKLLLASRPETPFHNRFTRCPQLRLETLTKSDILTYAKSRLTASRTRCPKPAIERKNASHREYDFANTTCSANAAEMKSDLAGLMDFIIQRANGVFLWVVLALNTTLDGLDHYDGCDSIREQLLQLPQELGGLFSHILTHRIPERSQSEAYRYLLIVSEWHILQHRPVPGPILGIAQQISDYSQACAIARFDRERYQATMADLAGRLSTRCQGLLECTPYQESDVECLHRSLYDFLKHDEVRRLLMMKTGTEFEVHAAIMAGIVCTLNHSDVYYTEFKQLMQWFCDFNAQAEISTGRHKTELIAAFACGDIADDIVKSGGILHVRQALKNPNFNSKQRMAGLLKAAMPTCRERAVTTNIPVAALLLEECGACPIYSSGRSNPWQHALENLSYALDTLDNRRNLDFHAVRSEGLTKTLDMIVLLARHVQDREKCRKTRANSRGGGPLPIAPSMMREWVLKRTCCYGAKVQDCYCVPAREWTSRALQVLQLLEAPTTDTSHLLNGAEEEWVLV